MRRLVGGASRARIFIQVITVLMCAVACSGCESPQRSVAETFPPGELIAPWQFEGEKVWSGSFADARPALGDDADTWGEYSPQRVWIANYRHRQKEGRRLVIRAFAFADVDIARAVLARFRPENAEPVEIREEGFHTQVGVMMRRGRMVYDVFSDETGFATEFQTEVMARYVEKTLSSERALDPK